MEIGEFNVIGPAGLQYLLGSQQGWFGEIVYLGTFLGDMHRYDGIGIDQPNGIHGHQIDNSAGHPHSELVDAKLRTHDRTIEYCTDARALLEKVLKDRAHQLPSEGERTIVGDQPSPSDP